MGAVGGCSAEYAGARGGGVSGGSGEACTSGGGSRGGEGGGAGPAGGEAESGDKGGSVGFAERLREERGLEETFARFMAARVAEPEFLLDPGERWMR